MKTPAAVAPYLDMLVTHHPFLEMRKAALLRLLTHARVTYHAAEETLLAAGSPVNECWVVLSGRVRAARAGDDQHSGLELTAGEMFPLGALLTERSSGSRYYAEDEVFALRIAASDFRSATQHSPVLAAFCDQQMSFLLERSRKALQASYVVEESAGQQLPRALSSLIRRAPLSVTANISVRDALQQMQAAAVGSVVVVDGAELPIAILTERDIIPRVVLGNRSIDGPVMDIATQPVATLSADADATDAALLMAERGFRHVVVVDAGGKLSGVVSERDLFALQRHTLSGISGAIGRAGSVTQLAACAADARQLARNLIAQGIEALTMTRFVSRLNDQLTHRLLNLIAGNHGMSSDAACWLALGSEGRHEQTISTDQDNALILGPDGDKALALAVATDANAALAECGFPLCKGNIMAGNPALTLTSMQWQTQFANWIERGDPQGLLKANIFFDMRPLWGNSALAENLQQDVLARAAANQRFQKQLADNARSVEPPLNWLGNLSATNAVEGQQVIDLKRFGIRPFVDAVRVLALANAVAATNTVERAGTRRPRQTDARRRFSLDRRLQLHAGFAPAGAATVAHAGGTERGGHRIPQSD